MGVVEEYEIHLDKEVWVPGETVEGRLMVQFAEPMEMAGIVLKFTGEAVVTWRRDEHTHKKDLERYINIKQPVFGEKDGDIAHPAGEHSYPFRFPLPFNIPSSFHNVSGHVQYLVTSSIERPWKNDITCSKRVKVICPLDLNNYPSCKLPWEGRNQKELGLCCFASGQVCGQLCVDRQGYIPGQYIKASGLVENASNRIMEKTTITLNMRKVFKVRGKVLINTDKLVEVSKGPIQPGETQVWYREMIKVPFVPPSGLQHCKLIDINYFLEMTVYPRGPYKALKIPGTKVVHNITIGTTALEPFSKETDDLLQLEFTKMRVTPSPTPTHYLRHNYHV